MFLNQYTGKPVDMGRKNLSSSDLKKSGGLQIITLGSSRAGSKDKSTTTESVFLQWQPAIQMFSSFLLSSVHAGL